MACELFSQVRSRSVGECARSFATLPPKPNPVDPSQHDLLSSHVPSSCLRCLSLLRALDFGRWSLDLAAFH
jgi:hypothetical protein